MGSNPVSSLIIIQRISTSGLSKTNNTHSGIESAEYNYLTFLDNSFCPENQKTLTVSQMDNDVIPSGGGEGMV